MEADEGGSCLSGTAWNIVIVVLILLVLKRVVDDLRKRIFAAYVNNFTNHTDPKVEAIKKEFLGQIATEVSQDPHLRKLNTLKILEIGVGAGSNFMYYPDGTRLVVVDPNPHFKTYYNTNRKKFPNIHSEDIIVSMAEEMDMVPANSVDLVVSTWVFCSVTNTEKILQQVLRVLAPGGKFYFFEHILEFDLECHRIRQKVMRFLTATGIWPFLFAGCYLNRDMLEAVQKAGFSKVQAQRIYNAIDHPIFDVINPTLKGIAEK